MGFRIPLAKSSRIPESGFPYMGQMIDYYTSLVNCFINIYTSGKDFFFLSFFLAGVGGRMEEL